MKITLFIVLMSIAQPSHGAMLHIDNQSRYVAIILEKDNEHPCLQRRDTPSPCLVPPLTTYAYELSDDHVANGTLRIVSMPITRPSKSTSLTKYAFKSTAHFTYQPIGPLKYEQLTCTVPINEGVIIRIELQGIQQASCHTATDRHITWVYKRNDVNVKFVIEDHPSTTLRRR